MNLQKIIYDVREGVKAYTDDSNISDRYITYLYGIKRAKYLRQELNDTRKTTDISVTQTFCLELEYVSINQCGLDIECDKILRTKRPIPNPLELHTKVAITVVKPTNRIALPFNFVSKEKAIYSKHSPYKRSIFAFLDTDKYIYILSESNTVGMMESISISGVFEDPLELRSYMAPAGTICFDDATTDYPLQSHLIDLIKTEIVNELLGKLKIPEDTTNNSNNE
jgi:hypothetical protein